MADIGFKTRSFSISVDTGRKNLLTGIKTIGSRTFKTTMLRRFAEEPLTKEMAEQVEDNTLFTGARLPRDFIPSNYELSLRPSFEDFTFTGTVRIIFSSSKNVDHIILHANQLKITDGYYYKNEQGDPSTPLQKVTYCRDSETVVLDFGSKVVGAVYLNLNFTGVLGDKMKGFYRTSFKMEHLMKPTKKYDTVYGLTTQFEATDARRCFPCFDEPDFKATFSVTLRFVAPFQLSDGTPCTRKAISNTKVDESLKERDRYEVDPVTKTEYWITKFERTPKMSTYLLAFVICPLDYIEERIWDNDRKKHINIRVYTIPGKKEEGRFALNVAVKALRFYEQYFGYYYPLPKLDMVAIPDFCSGAMENWGLITYRESCLLFDEKKSSTLRKQYVAIVVAHEIAHQWFGNLVTMKWWTHLWLNEGFASFMEYVCVDHIFPEWDMWSQFITDQYLGAMELDSLHNSHPIEVPVNYASEIDEIFDSISYDKGASVIRMLHNYIGNDPFRLGLSFYIHEYAYKNASTEDLWNQLGVHSKKQVVSLMKEWTSVKGYPWLSVTFSQDQDDAKFTITQSKFSADGKLSGDEAEVKWKVPLSWSTGQGTNGSYEMADSAEITVQGLGKNWIKFNPGCVGFYRVAYPPELLERLLPVIIDKSLPPIDRLGLQYDCFALSRAGKIPTTEFLKLLEVYKGETNCNVWSSIDSSISQLDSLLANTNYQDKLHAFGRDLYAKIHEKLGWQVKSDESHLEAIVRPLVINRLISFGDKKVIDEALRQFKGHCSGDFTIAGDIRAPVYKAVAMNGDDDMFDALFKIHRTDEFSEEKNRALGALGFAKSPEHIEKAIKFAMSEEVKDSDRIMFISSLGRSKPSIAWNYFKENKSLLQEKYGSGHLMTRTLKSCTAHFASDEMAKELETFFEENKFPGAERTIQQSIETVLLNASWLQRDGEAMKNYLSSSS